MLEHYQNFLNHHPLISAFDESQKETLLRAIHPHAVANGEHLFHQGDPAERFFLLVSGAIKLYRVSQEGNEKVVEIIQPGASFAEAIMFMEQPRFPVNAQAIKPSEVLCVNNEIYRRLLSTNPKTCFRLLADLSMRLHKRLNEIETLTLQNATYRVIRYFLTNKTESNGETVVQLPASKRLVAAHLAIQPETFSRILGKLRDEGYIEVHARSIKLLDVEGLTLYQ